MQLETRRFRKTYCCGHRLLILCCLVSLLAAAAAANEKNSAADRPGSAQAPKPAKPDYSKEAFVIQNFGRTITFAADGTWKREQWAAIKMQSDAGVRQFGILGFGYNSDSEKIEIVYVRVRRSDDTVVSTPDSNIQDVSSEVSRTAPMYTDLREKQIPVKALGTGDVLEYLIRIVQTKPEVRGHFWYSQDFLSGAVVQEETLRIDVPSEKYVNVSSPAIKPEIREDHGRKIYFWKTAQLEPASSETESKKPKVPGSPAPSVQITSFQNWDQVGRWYGELQSSRIIVTPAIEAKAAELTRGLTNALEKEHAIYNYVSMQFRYISLSFGQGRYQPHAAEDVLSNQYGDCKDKHTLFAALLKAAGIEAWPALIGTGGKLDADVPSPAQFDHVITVLPGQPDYLWLDTTPEVAPFGVLQRTLRDKQALVIPPDGPAALRKTPVDLPSPTLELFDVKSSLSADGVLKGHVDVTLRGDSELVLRAIFHSLPPAQWQSFVQGLSYQLGFGGTVAKVSAENIQDLTRPFRYSYDYVREHYSDWDNRRITPPSPPFAFSRDEKSDKPTEPLDMDSPGEVIFRSTIQLPSGYSLEIPENASSQTEFSEYRASYSVKDGVLATERRLKSKISKVPVSAWADYLKFEKAVLADEGQYIRLTSTGGKPTVDVATSNPQAESLMRRAYDSLQNHDTNAARDLLSQAERINPKQNGLWAMYSYLFLADHEPEKSFDALRKEIQYHPDEMVAYKSLVTMQLQLRRKPEAIETLRTAVQRWPDDVAMVSQLSSLLIEDKRYNEAFPPVQTALAKKPDDVQLQTMFAELLLRTGRKDEGLAAAQKLIRNADDAMGLNNAAYFLADTETNLPLSREYAEKAVSVVEERMKNVTLSQLTDDDLQKVNELSSYWDTLGWAYFRIGELSKAEKYLSASWSISQNATAADHLGQVYQRQGKRNAAAHSFELALASNSGYEEAREHLRLLGTESKPSVQPLKSKEKVTVKLTMSTGEELGKLRTVEIPSLPKQEGSAEFFILLSPRKVEDVQFISGVEKLKKAAGALSTARYNFEFPDEGPEKIVRRGILSCSEYTSPSCQLVFLLPSTTKK